MDEFDPFESEFDMSVDPLTADQHGLAILSKLEEGENMRGDFDEEFDATIDANIPKLQKNLARYQEYKTARGENLFSYEQEVQARENAMGDEKLARFAKDLIQADEETFNSLLDENGDTEEFKLGAAFMSDPSVMKDQYKLRQLLKSAGYSEREIDSGAAEPHMRKRLGADEESSEPTLGAFSRWSLSKINEVDRRRHLSKSAADQAFAQFAGTAGDVDTFEEALEKANPDLSNSERVELRRLYNINTQNFEKQFGGIRETVQKAFNTIAEEDGINSSFGEVGKFENLDEAADMLSKVPRKDFPKVVAMLANTAETHGQDMDAFAAKLGARLSRSATGLLDRSGMGGLLKNTQRAEEEFKKRIASGSEIWVPKGLKKGPSSVAMHFMVNGARDSQTGGFDQGAAKFFDAILPGKQNSGEYRQVTGEELDGVLDAFKQTRHKEFIADDLRNWRETVAKIRGRTGNAVGDAFMDDWVYGVAGSLPEMGATMMSAAGMSLVANAKYAENMAEIRRRNPTLSDKELAKHSSAANVGALSYTLLGRAQLKVAGNLMRKLPKTGAVITKLGTLGAVGGTVVKEAVLESVQDLTLASALELYGALDEDIKDFQMLPKDADYTTLEVGENDGELLSAVKRFPRTMFAVAPLAIAGVGGRKALNYLDQKTFEKLFKDVGLMQMYGVDPYHQANIRELSTDGALDYIRENNMEFENNRVEMEMPNLDYDAQIIAQDNGSFSVTNGASTVLARSPEEAAEAVQQLDPKFVERANPQVQTSREPKTISEPELARLSAEAVASPEVVGANPIRWELPTEPVLQVEKPVSHPEITKSLEGVLKAIGSNTPIRFSGRKVPKSAAGVYYLNQKIIRVRKHNGVTTVAHEVAHAIEDQFLEGGFGDDKWVSVRKASPNMAQELDKMGNDLYKGKAPTNTTMSEGFAEFFRMKIEGHDMAKIAPLTDIWFRKNILDDNPHVAKAIELATKKAVEFAGQGSLNRGKAGVSKQPGRLKRLSTDATDFVKNTPDEFIDMLFPIKRIVDAAETQLGKELENNPYETASQLRMTHDAIVKYMVEDGMRDFTGNVLGPNTSLKSAVELIGDKRDEFTIYLWAKRTLALDASGRESGLSLEDANKIFEELNSPTFEAAAARVYDWNNGVLQYAADSSADYAEVVDKIRTVDPGNYIPLFREFNSLDKGYQRGAPGAHGAQLVKKLKGSTRRIKDPFESMITQARSLVLRANQRAVIEQVLDITEKVPDMGQFMFEVSPDTIPVAHRNVVETLDEVSRSLEGDLKGAAKDLRDMVGESAQADQMVTLWGQAYMPPNKLENPIIPIFRDGKRRWYEVDRTAYEALMGMEVYRLPKFFDATVGMTNRMFKLGTTGYRASFSMVTNPLRDVRTLVLNTQSNKMMPELLGTWTKTMGETLINALSGGVLANTAWRDTYRRLGLEMSTPLGEDSRPTQAAARRLFQGKVLRTVHPANILDYVRDLFQYAESATRITEMKLLASEIGWNPKTDKLTPEIAQKLALAAKRVTTDFTAAGATMRMVNQVLPFSNAQIQGVRAHVRALQANPVKFAIRGVYGSAAAIGLWLTYKDEEWWKTMPMNEKYGYTYIPVTTPDGSEELIRIPRAFEADGFFMALPVAMLDAMHEDNPEEAVKWAEEFVGSFKPSKPVLLTAYTEQKANRVEFFDRPIVPRSEKSLDVDGFRHLQYGPHNTRFAIELGEIFDVSPRRIDHGIKSFTGGAGGDFVALFGRGPADQKDGVEREDQLSDVPVIGTLFSSVGQSAYVPEPIDELYTKLDYANANRKIKGDDETKSEKLQRMILKDATSMLSSISEIEKLEMKTNERRRLRAMKIQIAKEAVESFDSDKPSRRQFTEWKRKVKALKN